MSYIFNSSFGLDSFTRYLVKITFSPCPFLVITMHLVLVRLIFCNKWHMKINLTKTKGMVIIRNGHGEKVNLKFNGEGVTQLTLTAI